MYPELFFFADMQNSRTVALELLLIVIILGYGLLLAKIIPDKAHIVTNLIATLSIIILGLVLGLNLSEMGMTLQNPNNILFITSVGIVLFFLATFLITFVPFVKKLFINQPIADAKKHNLFFEAGFRIPLGTALVEETLFRGVLLGLLMQNNSTLTASIISALVFGLWHIFPTINSLEKNEYAKKLTGKSGRQVGSIIGVVVVTTLAGLFFNWLRIISGTILTPWLMHWAINSSGSIVAAFVGKIDKNKV